MGAATKGRTKFANNPATTTINASAIAKMRLRILKLTNNLCKSNMIILIFFYVFDTQNIVTKTHQWKLVRTKKARLSPKVRSISKDAYRPM